MVHIDLPIVTGFLDKGGSHMMNARGVGFTITVLFGVFYTVCLNGQTSLLPAQARGPSQSQSTLRDLFRSKAEISKLDWIFLNARVAVLEELGTSSPSPGYSYDPT